MPTSGSVEVGEKLFAAEYAFIRTRVAFYVGGKVVLYNPLDRTMGCSAES